jgi:hypothetical protein
MSPTDEVTHLLEMDRAVLKRCKTHNVWQLSNGKTFVQSRTPSDKRAALNCLTGLRRLLEIERPARVSVPRSKPKAPPRVDFGETKRRTEASFCNNLKLAGVVRSSLQDRVSALLDELRRNRA